jgi:hypothetical protein
MDISQTLQLHEIMPKTCIRWVLGSDLSQVIGYPDFFFLDAFFPSRKIPECTSTMSQHLPYHSQFVINPLTPNDL